jgi:hypothetical protein
MCIGGSIASWDDGGAHPGPGRVVADVCTPLDLVRVTSTAKSFRVAYVYARGR